MKDGCVDHDLVLWCSWTAFRSQQYKLIIDVQ